VPCRGRPLGLAGDEQADRRRALRDVPVLAETGKGRRAKLAAQLGVE